MSKSPIIYTQLLLQLLVTTYVDMILRRIITTELLVTPAVPQSDPRLRFNLLFVDTVRKMKSSTSSLFAQIFIIRKLKLKLL